MLENNISYNLITASGIKPTNITLISSSSNSRIGISDLKIYNNDHSKYYTYRPEKDITTFELAKLLPILLYYSSYKSLSIDLFEEIEDLKYEARRHFKLS